MKQTLVTRASRILSRSSTLPFESPVPHLFKSNDAPTDTEILLIKETIILSHSHIDALPTTSSEQLRMALVQSKKTHEALLLPTRRIPMDSLVLIFVATVQDDTDFFTVPVVSRVCHLWREVAVSTTDLWRSIAFHGRPTISESKCIPQLSHQESLANLKLERSRQTQLRILIVGPWLAQEHNPVFHKLLDCSDRWFEATVFLLGSTLPCLNRIEGRLSTLRCLAFYTGSEGAQRCSVFQQAPLLRHVYLYAKENLALPWTQIETYYEGFSGAGITDKEQKICLLKSASRLKISWATDLVIPTDPFLCTNLEALDVTFPRGARPRSFSRLQAPKIKEIEVLVHGAQDLTADLKVMIEKSPPPCLLRKLRLNYVFNDQTDLASLLRLTPELEELDIFLPNKLDLRGLFLNPEKNPAPLIPKLRKLGFLVCVDSDHDFVCLYLEIVIQIASTRCESDSASRSNLHILDSFTLEFPDYATRGKQLKFLEKYFENAEVPYKYFQWVFALEDALKDTASVNTEPEYGQANIF